MLLCWRSDGVKNVNISREERPVGETNLAVIDNESSGAFWRSIEKV